MQWLNRILVAVLIAAAIAYGPGQLEVAAGSDDLSRVEDEREALQTTNAELREEIRLLRAEVRALAVDPSEVARIAREDLNLVAPGEVVFEVERVQRPAPKTPK